MESLQLISDDGEDYVFQTTSGGKFKPLNLKTTWDEINNLYIKDKNSLKSLKLLEHCCKTYSPLRFDVDITYPTLNSERQYTSEHVKMVIRLIFKKLETISRSNPVLHKINNPELKRVCVFGKKITPECKKDGFHLFFPDILIDNKLEHLFIDKELTKNLTLKWEKVAQEEVVLDNIMSKPWVVYGSSKNGSTLYELEKVYNHKLDHLSIVPFNRPSVFTINKTGEYFKEAIIIQSSYKNIRKSDYETFIALWKELPDRLAEEYDSWIKAGIIAKNLAIDDEGNEDMRYLEAYKEFSQKSSQYEEKETEAKWKGFKKRNITIGSLYHLLKDNNYEKYCELKEQEYKKTFYKNFMDNKSFGDMAGVLVTNNTVVQAKNSIKTNLGDISSIYDEFFCDMYIAIFGYDYLYCLTEKQWYYFSQHRYKKVTNETIQDNLRIHVKDFIMKTINLVFADLEDNKESFDISVYSELKTRISNVRTNLRKKMENYKDLPNITKYLRMTLRDETFCSEKNNKRYLVGCENGVLDLKTFKFRPGEREDRITFSTNIAFEVNPDPKLILEVKEYFEKIFNKNTGLDKVGENFLDSVAKLLFGGNSEKMVMILYGSTNVGKSQTIQFIAKALGDYATNLPTDTIYTSKSVVGKPNPALAGMPGKRVAFINELSSRERINAAAVKELSGGDDIAVRSLFKDYIKFKPQFTLCISSNNLPITPKDDDALWGRIKIFQFETIFSNNASNNIEECYKTGIFPRDANLKETHERLAPTLLYMLFKRLEKIKNEPIEFCEKINSDTRVLRNKSNVIARFVDEKILKDVEANFESLNILYNGFRNFCRNDYPSINVTNKNTFQAGLESYLGKSFVGKGDSRCLYGFKYI